MPVEQVIILNLGMIIKNDSVAINLYIVNEGESITNEVKKNGLIFDSKNELQCRIGDKLLFFISYNI
jgi:hypothetical protein